MEDSVNHRGCGLQNTSPWWPTVCFGHVVVKDGELQCTSILQLRGTYMEDGSTHCLGENTFGFIQLYCTAVSKVGIITGSRISCYAKIWFTSWL